MADSYLVMDYLVYILNMTMQPFLIYYNCPFFLNVMNVRHSFFILLFIQFEGRGGKRRMGGGRLF
jgi:hypothetical protein